VSWYSVLELAQKREVVVKANSVHHKIIGRRRTEQKGINMFWLVQLAQLRACRSSVAFDMQVEIIHKTEQGAVG
jgi:hypothetical protein